MQNIREAIEVYLESLAAHHEPIARTASGVVGAGLRCLKDEKRARLPALPKTPAELEAQLLQSIERLDRGEGANGEAVFQNLRRRIRESQRRA